jgi:hypothetical protein
VDSVRHVGGMAESLPPIAVLLREARDAYGVVIRREVERKGMTPPPPNGAFVLGALHFGMSREDVMHQRGQALDKGRALPDSSNAATCSTNLTDCTSRRRVENALSPSPTPRRP